MTSHGPRCAPRFAAALVALVAATPAASAQATASAVEPPRFELTLLRVPDGLEESTATHLNERGEIAGVLVPDAPQLVNHTAFWSDAEAVPVLATGPGSEYSWPSDLGLSGLVVGNGYVDAFAPHVPFTWQPGQDVEPVPDSGAVTTGQVSSMNDRGVLVGAATFPILGPRPARWVHGVPQDLGIVAGDKHGCAYAISESGHIVGRSGLLAARWNVTGTQVLRLEFPGATHSWAADVNDRGLAVGEAHVPGFWFAVLWRGTQPLELPTLGGELGEAHAINDRDWIVGATEKLPVQTSELDLHATLWIREQAFDLNSLIVDPPHGVHLSCAWDVNDAGQIVGQAVVDDVPRAFLLDPHDG